MFIKGSKCRDNPIGDVSSILPSVGDVWRENERQRTRERKSSSEERDREIGQGQMNQEQKRTAGRD